MNVSAVDPACSTDRESRARLWGVATSSVCSPLRSEGHSLTTFHVLKRFSTDDLLASSLCGAYLRSACRTHVKRASSHKTTQTRASAEPGHTSLYHIDKQLLRTAEVPRTVVSAVDSEPSRLQLLLSVLSLD